MPSKWLAKSEPSVYSISQLKRDKKTLWTGVRNYQARNFLRDGWKENDLVLFYHSNADTIGVAGVAVVSKAKVVDPTQFDPKSEYFDPKAKKDAPIWYAPEIKFREEFSKIVELDEIKKDKTLAGMGILKRGNRLSVQPVSETEFNKILKLAGCKL